MRSWLSTLILGLLFLLLALRGVPGNPRDFNINDPYWKDEGPFELSTERGRFALTYSFLEDNSLTFSLPLARFVTPDLGFYQGRYVSLLAPAVSFLIMPGYLIGKLVNLSQVGSYFMVAIFALANLLLIKALAEKLGVNHWIASLAALTFVFATPAFAYGVSLYQHHFSTFFLLLSLWLAMQPINFWRLSLIWISVGLSLLIDYPNLFLMAPIALWALGQTFKVIRLKEHLVFQTRLWVLLAVIFLFLPLILLVWFNVSVYKNPLQLSGTVQTVKMIDEEGKPVFTTSYSQDKKEKTALKFFLTRNLLNGFWVQWLSLDRGVLFFSPVLVLALPGLFVLYRQNQMAANLFLSSILVNILIYGMWGDPWGGWGFGSRYLIPSFALLAIILAVSLNHWRRSAFFALFILLFAYSCIVASAGALSTNKNPPSVELGALSAQSGKVEKLTFDRNLDYLKYNSKSFIYQVVGKRYLAAWHYYLLVVLLIVGTVSIFSIQAIGQERRKR